MSEYPEKIRLKTKADCFKDGNQCYILTIKFEVTAKNDEDMCKQIDKIWPKILEIPDVEVCPTVAFIPLFKLLEDCGIKD